MIALCLSIGTHWAALQSVAWATMLLQNAKYVAITQAVAQTFDGSHPCSLCKGVAAAQRAPTKAEAQPLTAKPDLFCSTNGTGPRPDTADSIFASLRILASQRFSSPPTPPPRTHSS
jgi:hypothetical protein